MFQLKPDPKDCPLEHKALLGPRLDEVITEASHHPEPILDGTTLLEATSNNTTSTGSLAGSLGPDQEVSSYPAQDESDEPSLTLESVVTDPIVINDIIDDGTTVLDDSSLEYTTILHSANQGTHLYNTIEAIVAETAPLATSQKIKEALKHVTLLDYVLLYYRQWVSNWVIDAFLEILVNIVPMVELFPAEKYDGNSLCLTHEEHKP